MSLGTVTFEPGSQMLSPRDGCASALLDASRALFIGGGDWPGSYFATTEVLYVYWDDDVRARPEHASEQMRGCAAAR